MGHRRVGGGEKCGKEDPAHGNERCVWRQRWREREAGGREEGEGPERRSLSGEAWTALDKVLNGVMRMVSNRQFENAPLIPLHCLGFGCHLLSPRRPLSEKMCEGISTELDVYWMT
ncbi:hypothetical protein DPEC_G00332780 [Dallia pectoralis]|uniref:Uncharacterized protein n=1 Tax=Dallia pectoralis TaxID=75939 RepID=A0ACC2F6B3_DALPE|nr:hypothetical protein DPEC_G00332780 [Dallia pectoralis]